MAGLRVVRGVDWKWTAHDGGNGFCGTTFERPTTSRGWVAVVWDNGQAANYRMGAEDCCDLLVLDNGPAGVSHPGVQCDACSENNVRGLRWKCLDCPDYDLCTECYGSDSHELDHKFKRIATPGTPGANVGKRRNAVKIQSRGLYTGATVTRGPDWCKDDQDGGAGSVGTVTQVGYVKESRIDKACLVVKWPHDRNKGYIYRRGLGGNVDVKFKTAAMGWNYYRDHLPKLENLEAVTKRSSSAEESADVGDFLAKLFVGGLMESGLLDGATSQPKFQASQKKETMRKFSDGDLVRLHHDIEVVQSLQEGHGGFNLLMVPALGKTGVVIVIDSDGDLRVAFGSVKWTLNPAAVTKLTTPKLSDTTSGSGGSKSRFKAGDRVVIGVDQVTATARQIGHGGWTDSMIPYTNTGVAGHVKGVDGDGDVIVDFNGHTFLLNPSVCSAAASYSRSSSGTSTATPTTKFSIGDRVKIDRDLDFVKQCQVGHGGWNGMMKKLATSSGVVKGIDSDGDLKISLGDQTWTISPEACHHDKPSPVRETKTTGRKEKNSNAFVEPETAPTPAESSFKVGDSIRVDRDLDFVKRVQKDHGGWNDEIKKYMTKVGTVLEVDGDGDLRVDFGGKRWIFNPAACHRTSPPAASERQNENNAGTREKSSDAPPAKPVNHSFTVGDSVRISQDVDRIKQLQRGHGGWNDGIRKVMGLVGTIEAIDSNGDVKVDFSGQVWTFNPQLCQKATGRSPGKKDGNENESATPSGSGASASSSGGLVDFDVDEQVKVCCNLPTLRDLQNGHGGYQEGMDKIIGKIGLVKRVLANGDVCVRFVNGLFTLNPEVCVSLSPEKQKGKQRWTPSDNKTDSSSKNDRSGSSPSTDSKFVCVICMENTVSIFFQCGHSVCRDCDRQIDDCHTCRKPIVTRTKMFIS